MASGIDRVDVLLVDDEPIVARLHSRVILAQGLSVAVVDNAYAALDMVDAARPKLIISDMQMPGMDGIEMLKSLVADRKKTMPLMFLSAARAEEIMPQALVAGADDFLPKGAGFNALMARVKFWVETALQGLPMDARHAAVQCLPKAVYADDMLRLLDIPRVRLIERTVVALTDQILELGPEFGEKEVDRIRFMGVVSGVLTVLGRNDPLSYVRRGDYILAVMNEIKRKGMCGPLCKGFSGLSDLMTDPTYRQARESLVLKP